MRKISILLMVLVMTLGIGSCTKVYNERDPDETPSNPSSPTPIIRTDKVEFRVIGKDIFGPVQIKHTDSINGVTLYTGSLPYLAATQSRDESIFLFIEATGEGQFSNSGLQVQIFVNGNLFREAFDQGFVLSVQANGTYRR